MHHHDAVTHIEEPTDAWQQEEGSADPDFTPGFRRLQRKPEGRLKGEGRGEIDWPRVNVRSGIGQGDPKEISEIA
jgi:hypothetical protein